MTIAGRPASTHASFDVVDPATGQPAGRAPECSPEQVDEAVAAAVAAFGEEPGAFGEEPGGGWGPALGGRPGGGSGPAWRHDEAGRRQALRDIADTIEAHHGELTRLLVLESGKPLAWAAGEVSYAPSWFRYYADLDIPREVLRDVPGSLVELAYRPLGVVAAITPWNGPIGMAAWKVAPALRAGNTVVLKPSPFTPLATLRLGELLAGVLPPGVLNVVSGGDDVGRRMTAHPAVRKISFTGSTGAGRQIAAAAGSRLARVTLELGGNDAAILLEDVDVPATAAALAALALKNCGQICAIPKRIFAPAAIYADVVAAFADAYGRVVVGGPYEPGVTMGPLSTRPQWERVRGLVTDAVARGGRIATGGAPPDRPGFFYPATVVADVAEGVPLVDEEQFGPVTPIIRYDRPADAVARANATEFGLCGSVWSADPERAAVLAERLETGMTYVNGHGGLPPELPFFGARSSGIGVANGLPGLLEFTQPQVVTRARG
ncbi:aldehyde dehydrogenase [Frankia sp. CcI49]|uniref:aldehyde dehydrogenase family protein n=1 Tax=unclassified Frankia TaxID=2632575 RepID=UPI0006CA3543|nr:MULTISPECIES: aldehyde dehydrogenase family protein [unclassified Frankia]KPM54368.1 aldehyde dehydrogenase [Frankia sp. R43]ONH58780.1 aldehyde dehydrogenase [Frankia sp. CcI49]